MTLPTMVHPPVWMDHLKAKSPDMGGQTLAQHTWDVLARMAMQREVSPHLSEWLGERIWSQVFWAGFLHDFGKAAAGFQGVLRGEKGLWSERRHRHEVLSLGFADWLFPKGHPDRDPVLAMVAFHHKDAEPLYTKYGGCNPPPRGNQDDSEWKATAEQRRELADNIDRKTRDALWRWIDECAADWAAALGFRLIDPPPLLSWEQAEVSDLEKSIYKALRALNRLNVRDAEVLRSALLVRGLILTADHSASAGVTTFTPMPLTRAHAEAPLTAKGRTPLDHQRAAAVTALGSTVLVAPTGSGKTEAALLWAAQQLELRSAGRLFYTLPYQASMNAMFQRLAVEFLGHRDAELKAGQVNTITIRHSRALLRQYQDMMSLDEREPREVQRQAKWLKNKTELNTYPIQVFSPYQMLKVAYSLKGFEALLLDYTDALFIFDEIHAYEPKRLALIIELMGWLRRDYGARFFVMTATLPPMLQAKLVEALEPQVIHATPAVFAASQRHRVLVLEGRLSEQIADRIRTDWQAGRVVLVCLNRIADAQRVYRLLRDTLTLKPDDEIVLLHGRFNGQDRARKEAVLMSRAGVGRADRRPFICVATQVVEVSLNVDFDTLYTDPAPLEALLQRFGRVNRGRGAGSPLLPVHVLTQPDAPAAQKPYLPYDAPMVERSVEVLRRYCDGGPIDEALVTTMLGEIYSGDLLAQWEQEYAASALTFCRDILQGMEAFKSGDAHEFYRLFDSTEVLPIGALDAYLDAREQRGYLEASQYLVGVSYALYREFDDYGLIVHARDLEDDYADHIRVVYDAEYGLDIDGARQQAKGERGAVPAEWE